MKAQDISPPENYPHIPKEMERAKYWADLLDKATDKYDI
jgi:hypothetical protein